MEAVSGMIAGAEIASMFDGNDPLTVGAEEELMLLDPAGLDLAPDAMRALDLLGGDPRFKLELPASQIESQTVPADTVSELAGQLAASRRDLAIAVEGVVELAAAGVHPTAMPRGELNRGLRYDAVVRHYGRSVISRQLVCALQIHVAPGDAKSALGVYNALRSYLPEIAAVAANAPLFAGKDTGLASIRPVIAQLLPRQGVPPAFSGWDQFAAALEWGAAGGVIADPSSWWWELRPHSGFGTLELRVPDAQTTVTEAAAIAALGQCLVAWLTGRHHDGEALPVHASWQIAENRWRAARDGIEARVADLETGEIRPVRDRLRQLLADLSPTARRLGCRPELDNLGSLIVKNGAVRQREVAARSGIDAVPAWLRDQFLS